MSGSRPRSNYSFSRNGASSNMRRQGSHILKTNAIEHVSPCWGDGVTVIRPLPLIEQADDGTKQWTPYRRLGNTDSLNFGDWIRRYDAVRKFGDPGITMIINNPDDPNEVSLDETPAWILYNAIKKAIREKVERPGWAGMLEGGANRSAQLSRPSEVYLIPCLMMQNKTEKYMPPKGFAATDKPLMMELSSGAGNTLVAEMNKPRENSQAADGDWENMYEHGDPVSINYGRYITFYRLSDGDPRTRTQQPVASQHSQAMWTNQRTQRGGGQQNTREQTGFGCYIESTFDNYPASLAQHEAALAARSFSWDDVLFFPTLEEQARLIANSFPADAIMYAWNDHPEWIPQAVRDKAVAAHPVGAPVGGWPQFAPPQAGQQFAQPQPQGGNPQYAGYPQTSAPNGFLAGMQPGMFGQPGQTEQPQQFAPPPQPQGMQFAPPLQPQQPVQQVGSFAPPVQVQQPGMQTAAFAPPVQPQQFAPPVQPMQAVQSTTQFAQPVQQPQQFAPPVQQPIQQQPMQYTQPVQQQPMQQPTQFVQPTQPTIAPADAAQASWMGGPQQGVPGGPVNAMQQPANGFAQQPNPQVQQSASMNRASLALAAAQATQQ